MTYSTSAIILRRHDSGEWDRLYTAYTRSMGKLILMGKGTRRSCAKLAAHLEPFMETDLVIARGRTYDRVVFARTIHSSCSLATSFERFSAASFIAECVDQLTKECHPDEEMYDFLVHALRIITAAERGSASAVLAPMLIRFLALLGYAPALDRCVECRVLVPSGATIAIPARGGVACAICAARVMECIALSSDDRQYLALASATLVSLEPSIAVETFTRVHLASQLHAPLRSAVVGDGADLTRAVGATMLMRS